MHKFRYEIVVLQDGQTIEHARVIDHKTNKIVMRGTTSECHRWVQETLEALRA